jgi:hypothetical protein
MTKETIDETMARLGLTSEEDRAFIERHEAMHKEMRKILAARRAQEEVDRVINEILENDGTTTNQEFYEALCNAVAQDN